MRRVLYILAIGIMCAACNKVDRNAHLAYPEAFKVEQTDDYFGMQVADPYRWMEDDNAPEVAEWVKAQNKVTEEYLSRIPYRDKLKKRLTELVGYEKQLAPFVKNGKIYSYRNNGLQNQNVLYVQDSPDAPARVLLDPNTLSADGTVALTGVYVSNNGKYMAYTVSRSGSDWTEIYVMDLQTGQPLEDHITWAKFTGASWRGDGFYYSAYPAPKEGEERSGKNTHHLVYYHKIGDPQEKDELAFRNYYDPQRFYQGEVDASESYMFVYESGGGNGNRLFFRDLHHPDPTFEVIAYDDAYEYTVYEMQGDYFYVYTNYGAPMGKIMRGNVSDPRIQKWEELIPEGKDAISAVRFVEGRIAVTYSRDASDHVEFFDIDGNHLYELELPTFGSVDISGDFREKGTWYSFASFTFPSTVYSLDVATGKSEKYFAPTIDFNPEDFVCEEVFFKSKDGTRIPMFLTYKKGLQKDGNNPVYLYGYGGFNISITPSFSVYRIPFLESGGIYASVCLRGGSEYGEEWHLQGTLMQKQNVFDDCIAAAEYLIDEGWSNPSRMCLSGASNGGLLVGAVINQRPDLFAVALPAVGVMDMLRYHRFTIGWNWASDYGTSADGPEMFSYLYAYSPLHNIRNDGTPYPAVLVTTADHDDRVVPAHSFKYAATLQASDTGDRVKLIQIETDAGHGSGKPLSKTLQEQADSWSFTMWNMGLKY